MVAVPEEFERFTPLLSEQGKQDLIATIRDYRETYGVDEWLAKFKERNPNMIIVVDLCAYGTAAEALDHLKSWIAGVIDREAGNSRGKAFALQLAADAFLATSKREFESLHALVSAEMSRPIF
jgi:hypothetical protein